MKHLPKYYCDLDSDDDTNTNDDISNYSSVYEMSEPDSDSEEEDEVPFTHIDSLLLISEQTTRGESEETKDEREMIRLPTPVPLRQIVTSSSRFDFVSELVSSELWFASKDSLLHKIIDGRQDANHEIITLLAIFAIAQFANQGSVEYLYNTLCKHTLLAVDNIKVAFKDKCDPSTFIDTLGSRWLFNCFLSSAKINEHIMRKNAYIEKIRSLNLENTLRRLFVKDDDMKLQNFVTICEKLYNREYDTI
jgi:hypothetical protein